MKKMFHYSHPPATCNATLQQVASFKAFESWRGMITESMLYDLRWVDILHSIATKNAEREERAAQHASLLKWVKWIHEGPAAGLRHQHKYSRCATGWVPVANSSGKGEQGGRDR